MSKTKDSKLGGGCLFLFGLIFFLAGMIPGYIAISTLIQTVQARAWAPVPATILDAELNVSHGDDSTTYSVSGRFRYQFDGQTFDSTRVSFDTGSDNIGDFHQRTHALLERHRQSGEPMTAYVDPDDPSEAVLIRGMRWGLFAFMMVFPLTFGGVGAVIMGFSIYGTRKAKADQRRERSHPEEPWRWQSDWDRGELKCQTKATMWFAVGFAVFWNLISTPVAFMLPGEVFDNGNYVAAIGFVFPLVGIGLATWAVIAVLRWRRFGASVFVMDPLPATPGGVVAGGLRVPVALEADHLEATLSCVSKRTSGSGKNRSTRETVEWQDDRRIDLRGRTGAGARVPVRFELPPDAALTDAESNPSIHWKLEFRAEVPGVDFAARFDVPVFAGDPLAPISNLGAVAKHESSALPVASGDGGAWEHTGVVRDSRAGAARYRFRAARHKGAAAMTTGAAAVFGGAGGFMVAAGEAPTWFGAIFLLVGLLIAWFALELWLRRNEVRVRPGELSWRTGLGLLGGDRELRSGEIKDIRIAQGMEALGRRYYRLLLETHDGRTRILGAGLKGRRDSEALAAQIKRELGLRT